MLWDSPPLIPSSLQPTMPASLPVLSTTVFSLLSFLQVSRSCCSQSSCTLILEISSYSLGKRNNDCHTVSFYTCILNTLFAAVILQTTQYKLYASYSSNFCNNQVVIQYHLGPSDTEHISYQQQVLCSNPYCIRESVIIFILHKLLWICSPDFYLKQKQREKSQ